MCSEYSETNRFPKTNEAFLKQEFVFQPVIFVNVCEYFVQCINKFFQVGNNTKYRFSDAVN